MQRMKPERISEKKKSTRSDTVRSSLRSSNGTSSSSDASPNIASRPKRSVSKRSLDISDFLTSHEEERQLAKALKESLKELKKGDVTTVTKCSSVTSNGTSESSKESGVKTSDRPQPSSARPKRDAAQRASAITDLLCLKTKEERELRKAIELSRRSNLEEKRRREEAPSTVSPSIVSPSIVSPSSPVTDVSAGASTSSASNVNPRRREEDIKSHMSDGSSLDEMILKKPKIPPQRKFAHNSIPGHCSHHTTTCVKNAQSYIHNPHHRASVHHVKELFSAITPSTEDFLTFLCFRNAPVLPHKVDLFSINEKAIQEKSVPTPKVPSTQSSKSTPSKVDKSTPSKPDKSTPSKPDKSTPSKPDGIKMNGSSPHGKVLDSRRSSATSSSSVSNPFQRSNPPHRKSNIKLAIKSESSLIHERSSVKKNSLVHERGPMKKSSLVHERSPMKKSSLIHERGPVKRKEKSQDRSKDRIQERRKKAIMNQATKSKCSSSAVSSVKNSVKSSNEKKSKLDLTPTKRVTRSASSTAYSGPTAYPGPTAYSGPTAYPGSIRVRSVEEEVKAEREKRLKEQMMVIEKEHQVRRRFSSDSSIHSSDSSSSESLPSTSSSVSINISRVTRSIETLKQLRVMGQQSKLKNTPSITTRRGLLSTAPGGQVASKAILQRAKRNLNKCSNGKLTRILR